MMTAAKNKIHPQLFGLYLAMAGMIMMFVALTSAYLVRQAAGNWLVFPIPKWFYASTVLILVSSLLLHLSYLNYKNQQSAFYYRWFLVLSLLCSLGFIVLQVFGWNQLSSWGIKFTGNPAGSFVYVISGLHVLHVLGGIGALSVAVYHAFSLNFILESKRIKRFQLTSHYWHFVGVLWLYLIFFLIIQR